MPKPVAPWEFRERADKRGALGKRGRPSATRSSDTSAADRTVEKMIAKLPYRLCGILANNDVFSVSLCRPDRSPDGLGEFLRTCALGHEGAGTGSNDV
jgi:hypothetical protein